MPAKFNAVMIRCTQCEEEIWAGYILLPSEAAWFNSQDRRFRDTCPYCGAEILSDAYLKGIDSISEFFRGLRPKSVPPPGEAG